MFLFLLFFPNFLIFIYFKLKNSNLSILSKSLCFLVQLKLVHRFNVNFKIISGTLQQAEYFLWTHPQAIPWSPIHVPEALEMAQPPRGWGRWGVGRAWRLQLVPGPWSCSPRSHRGALQPSGFFSPQREQLARLIPGVVFGQIPVSEERAWWYKSHPSPDHCFYKCLHFAMSSELSAKITHGISRLALMAAWHMLTAGTWRTLWTSARGKSPHFTVGVEPAAAAWFLQVAARWNSCLPVSWELGCSSPRFTRT